MNNFWWLSSRLFILMSALAVLRTDGYLPVVVIPGIIDPYKHLQIVCNRIEEAHPGTNCTLVQPQFGLTSTLSMWTLYHIYLPHVKALFEANPDGIHIVAHSQGALIARAIIEKTTNHPVKVFVSIASPHLGVFGAPISFLNSWLNRIPIFRSVMDTMLYSWPLQHLISVTGYWKDPHNIPWYLKSNEFLPIINNEIEHSESEMFKNNFEQLTKFVLIGGPDDGVVKPWQSSQMEYIDANGTLVPLKEQEVYINNTFGIRTLDESGRLYRHILPNTTHNGFIDNPYCTEHLVLQYLT